MAKADTLEERVARIEARNVRVEADKSWENSLVRHAAITIGTYLTMALFLLMINATTPFLTAIVPAGAYILSTLTLRPLENWWLNRRYPEQKR